MSQDNTMQAIVQFVKKHTRVFVGRLKSVKGANVHVGRDARPLAACRSRKPIDPPKMSVLEASGYIGAGLGLYPG
ncbi:hypothetical protein BGZ89_008740 [Linnemannia elongata]|nr:hypothetical protein BGZ89_008740 [Linnemannia elongata]